MALTPSERIHAIKSIAKALGEEGWPLIDLTLKQFSAPTSGSSTGGKDGYIVSMLSDVSDEVLSQLIAHIGFTASTKQTVEVAPNFWAPDSFRLFASHLAKDKEYVTELQTQLLNLHIDTFVAHKDITPSLEWQAQIRAALQSCDALVALLTPDFHESVWTDQEVGFVMGRGRVTVAVRLGRDPYGFMGSVQAFQGVGKKEKALAEEVLDAFLVNPQTSAAMNEALISHFEKSDDFFSAQSNVKLLQRIKHSNPILASRIIQAITNNDQVGRAHAVPARVRELAEKWQ